MYMVVELPGDHGYEKLVIYKENLFKQLENKHENGKHKWQVSFVPRTYFTCNGKYQFIFEYRIQL